MGWKGKARSNNQMVLFWFVIIFSAILLAGYFLFSGSERSKQDTALFAPQEREQVPRWEVESLAEGPAADSPSLRGKIVVLHFWASWCPPCRKEFPHFIKWAEKNGGGEIAVIPVSLDQNKEEGKAFFEKYSRELPGYFDAGKTAERFRVNGIPATFVLDRKGRIAFSREGALEWTGSVIGKVVDGLSKEKE